MHGAGTVECLMDLACTHDTSYDGAIDRCCSASIRYSSTLGGQGLDCAQPRPG